MSKGIIIILALSLSLRVCIAVSFDSERVFSPDEIEYRKLSQNLMHDYAFTSTLRMPGYPLFLALVGPRYIFGAQVALNILTIYVLYILTLKLFGHRAGLWAAGLYAVNPLPAFYCFKTLTETLFTFMFLCVMGLVLTRYHHA